MIRRAFQTCFWSSLLLAASAGAALPIDLEVGVEADAPFGTIQQWHAILVEMDLAHIRLRGARGGDEPAVEVRGEGATATYSLVGVINRRDELVLPGGRFGQGDRAELKAYFEELPGRLAEEGVERGRFGLTLEQFEAIYADLSRPFEEPTLDGAPHELVATLTKDFAAPLLGSVETKAALRDAAPFAAQMEGLTTGTVLAAVLRAAGLQFVPEVDGERPLALRVTALSRERECWPVGWKPLGSPRQVAPAMYRVTDIEIENFTLDKALEALAPHMGVPLVFDQRTLASEEIDPAESPVRFPRSKTFVRRAVDSILSQSKLAGELRIDETGQPFYWITQFGPESPRATEVEERARAEEE
jgi:hypothetical protein